jgi:hypothetical protein
VDEAISRNETYYIKIYRKNEACGIKMRLEAEKGDPI